MRRHRANVVIHLSLIIICVLFAAPVLWLFVMALKTPAELAVFPPELWPQTPQWTNLIDALTKFDFFKYARNSLIISTISASLTTASSAFVAFGLARTRARGKKLIFGLVLGSMMLPGIVTLIPTYIIYSRIGFLDTYFPWVLMGLGGSSFMIFFVRQAFLTVPSEIEDAAIVDGCNIFQVWWRMYLPLSKAVLAAVFLLDFVGTYSDYIMPKLLLSLDTTTLAVAVTTLYKNQAGLLIQPLVAAGALWFALPAVLLFFLLQRYFVQGFATSGMK